MGSKGKKKAAKARPVDVPEDAPEHKDTATRVVKAQGLLELEYGKRYYRRDGAITGPLEPCKGYEFGSLYDPEHHETYYFQNKGFQQGSTGHYKADLVSECKAEVADKDKGLDKLIKDISKAGSPVSIWGEGYGPPYVPYLTIRHDFANGKSIGYSSSSAESNLHGLVSAVVRELLIAQKLFPAFNSLHEAMSVLREEVDELWEEVRKKQVVNGSPNLARTAGARKEAVQVVAMAMRLVLDNCTEGKPGYGK